jgi:hypothetical protein
MPLNRFPQANVERRPRPEPEFPIRPAYVQAAARLAIRLGGVPDDPSREAGEGGNIGGQVASAPPLAADLLTARFLTAGFLAAFSAADFGESPTPGRPFLPITVAVRRGLVSDG